MIKANAHKYSVSAMCRVLQVNRSTYYYEAAAKKDESELTADIQEIFRKSRNHYGTRKIKKELADCGKQVSRRRIGRIMKQEGLVSSYTTAQFKPQKDRCNESKVENVLNRQFQNQPYRNVVVSDLTYVRVGNRWNYICVLIDLFNREIIGYSAGEHKTAELVKQAFMKVDGNLSEIHIFHTDRGNEFKNETIEELLETFHMERSLSHKGCPYDNAVAEATFKIIKTEFVWNDVQHLLDRHGVGHEEGTIQQFLLHRDLALLRTNFIKAPGYYDGTAVETKGLDRYEHLAAALRQTNGVVADKNAAMDLLASVGRRTWNNDDSNTNTIHSVVYDLTDRSVLWVGNEHYGEDGYTFEFQLGA